MQQTTNGPFLGLSILTIQGVERLYLNYHGCVIIHSVTNRINKQGSQQYAGDTDDFFLLLII